jgi:aromatic-L-amino-acid/L-tryptophan decarboxylase
LGRRFRALKLWFVLRYYGAEELRLRIRNHCAWAEELAKQMAAHPHFEVMAPVTVNLVCFRWKPKEADTATLNQWNENLMQRINESGRLYLSHTKIRDNYVIRLVGGHANLTREHLQNAWELVQKMAGEMEIEE